MPLHVALLWHMHQPYYIDAVTGKSSLPWVRLHATKDYLHMAEVLRDHPRIHLTFNLVPSLIEQLEKYVRGETTDRCLELSLQEDWSEEEREYLLSFAFSLNWERVVRPYPRYEELLQLWQAGQAHSFTATDYRDLVAWFNLAWIDPNWLERDETLRRLVEKGRGYDKADIEAIIAKQFEMIALVLPSYRDLQERGQVELITSPYYHPILPLLVDLHAAKEASPHLSIPPVAFRHPEDGAEQIRQAMESHRARFGRQPQGVWPPEGAVGQAVLPLLERQVRWLASDEGILAQSLGTEIARDGYGHVSNPQILYQPYRVGEAQSLSILFRDRALSDRIGFVYKHWAGKEAAEDLVGRLHHIREALAGSPRPYLVTIILDGENCWGDYEHNGDLFLHHLYSLLSTAEELQTTTVSEYLERYPPEESISHLFSGSWINHNLETWIGGEEQNRAWEYLERSRDRLIAWQREYPLADLETLERAWREIYIAEGSDWFWWYCSHNVSAQDYLFDEAFRGHLSNVFILLGLPVPSWLKEPIAGREEVGFRPVAAYISPRLSPTPAPSLEWASAGFVDSRFSEGTMQRGRSILRRLYYGHNPADLYLRLESNEDLSPYLITVYLSSPRASRVNKSPRYADNSPEFHAMEVSLAWEIAVSVPDHQASLSRADGQEVWRAVPASLPLAVGERALELSIPLANLGLQLGDDVSLVATVVKEGVIIEAFPLAGYHTFTLAEL
jgi:alpha-amylase/alpha-mannosidase (GH57 family)